MVKAITGEAKWSGSFRSVFPLLALVGIILMQPGYYDEVMKTSIFLPACIVVGVMLIMNVVFMKMLVNIKV
jgi:tight adherence protein B